MWQTLVKQADQYWHLQCLNIETDWNHQSDWYTELTAILLPPDGLDQGLGRRNCETFIAVNVNVNPYIIMTLIRN